MASASAIKCLSALLFLGAAAATGVFRSSSSSSGELIKKTLRLASASSCADNTFRFNVTNTTLTPDPPVLGSNAFLNGTGVLDVAGPTVTNGTIVMTAYLDGIPLYTNNGNSCGQSVIDLPLGFGTIGITSFVCPAVVQSVQNMSVQVLIPSGIPSGSYNIIINASDQALNNLYCLNATFAE